MWLWGFGSTGSLTRVLASRTATPPPVNRTKRAEQRRKRRTPLALIIIPIVLIVGAGVIVLFLTGNADKLPGPLGGGDEPVPQFSFKLAKVQVVGTAEDADNAALKPVGDTTAADVAPVLDQFFTDAFLDPNKWKDGNYEDALAVFSDAALPSAQTGGLETLTLGANAGDTYDSVVPDKGSIRYDVLFDRDGNPFDVAAHVKFYATGKRQDATYVGIVSHGVLFLEDTGDGWRITAYDMKRNDHETEAPSATPTSSSSSAATTGASGAS
jgi:hypothetical protein